MIVVVDTDALLGLVNPNDALHHRATAVLEELTKSQANISLLPTTLAEFALLATYRIGVVQTKEAVNRLHAANYVSIEITKDLTNEAVNLYQKQTSKEESLFDCFVMVGAKWVGADCIFSFDDGYSKNGFKLASEGI